MTSTTRVPQTAHPHPWHLAGHMVGKGIALLPLGGGTLFLGMALYHFVEQRPWPDAFLNAAMLLGGMGPVAPIETAAGKWLIGLYALFAGVVFLVVAGIMLGPVIHAMLERFHLEAAERTRAAARD